MTETIYILLPVHNRREVTHRFVTCLKGQTGRSYHLVLVDDGSTDGTAEMVQEAIPSLSVIRGTGDWWWGGSLQQGYLWLREQKVPATDLVLIINDDTEFGPDFLARGAALMAQQERTLLLAQCYSRQDGRLLDAGVRVDWRRLSYEQAAKMEEINCLSTRGLFMRVGDFLAIGGFHPVLLPHYGSDYEFTIRAGRMGMRLVTDPSLSLRVDEETTGSHAVGRDPFTVAVSKLFSKRSVLNPIYRSCYIALACPWRWKLLNLTRIWRETALVLLVALGNSVRKAFK